MSVLGYPRQRVWLHGLSALVIVLILPLGYGVFLVWQEWQFRQRLVAPVPFVTATTAPATRERLEPTALATVFGLSAETALLPSAEPLTLQASFVVSTGLSRALLADAQGPRLYQVGERLPGGSVLRRVEASQVVLWNKGREEVLPLQPSTVRFLRRFESNAASQTSAISVRYLRPLSGQSE
jgi:hypothetical protein